MTPARIASLAVALVLTIVLTPLRADDGSFAGALLVALLGAVLLVAGAWFAPLARAEGTMGGTPRAPWRPEYEGPKTTQVAGGGLVALLVGLITGGAPFVGPLLGIVAAVAAGRFLHIPSAAEVEAVVGSQEQEQEQEQVDDDGDGGAAFDTAPVPVVEAPGSGPTAEVHGSTAAPAADEADRTP
ncbi:hypothetical protein [Micrococcus lacusdianchii]|uniref:hypothetical protein n=1 Tax=Micrococcus lacusdianchii TaxID=2915940 RepID=UPI0020031797|nr:hypothetical protein [Micrococcus sp. JXJ CY 30]